MSVVREYCPSRYEDAPPTSSAVDRVTQLRSRIRSLQDSKNRTDSEQKNIQGSTAVPANPWGVSTSITKKSSMPKAQSLPSSQPFSRPPSRPPTPSPAPEQQDKLSSILSFLDEVEESSRADKCSLISSAQSSRVLGDSEACNEIFGSSESGGLEKGYRSEASSRVVPLGLAEDALALQSRVSLLEVEVNDKRKTIETLKRAVAEIKERERQAAQDVTKDWDEKLQKQKDHYEANLERQLKLVDRLLNDKTELTKRCELFSEELKAVERKFQMKMEELDEQASKNLARQKQNWMAAEKLRREAWEKDKTREIKEVTIKGLEPEVERILAERRQEKVKLDERHKETMDLQRQELLELGQKQIREARESLAKEHEKIMDQEREAHRQKLREEFDKFSVQLQEERSKCAADILAERRKHEQVLQQEVHNLESRHRESVANQRAEADAAMQGIKISATDAEERHRNELANLQERLRGEREQWQQDYIERSQADFERRETALREQLLKERERQLDVVVDRLGREHLEQQHILKADNVALVERVRSEAMEQVRKLTEQLEEARAQVAEVERQRALLEQSVKNLETKVEAEEKHASEAKLRIQQLENDLCTAQKSAEIAFETHRDELLHLSDEKDNDNEAARIESARLNARILEERARAEELQKEAKQREEKIIADLEARVKRTLQAKDDTIAELRTRCAASENKNREFEYLLARQREELLSGITKDILS